MLIVTAYYDIPSKQSSSFYYEHIKRFFKYIDVPVLFFTDQVNYDKLKQFARYNVIFKIQPFENMSIFTEFPVDFWKDRISRDAEKYHTWQLGAIWCNKSGFVKQATDLCPDHDWYMWVDAACVRTDSWSSTLSMFGKRELPKTPGIYLQLLNQMPHKKRFFAYRSSSDYDVFIAGSHCLFHKNHVNQFVDAFHKTIQEYDNECKSLISDQHIMSTMTYDYTFIMPILYDISLNSICEWFFFFSVF